MPQWLSLRWTSVNVPVFLLEFLAGSIDLFTVLLHIILESVDTNIRPFFQSIPVLLNLTLSKLERGSQFEEFQIRFLQIFAQQRSLLGFGGPRLLPWFTSPGRRQQN